MLLNLGEGEGLVGDVSLYDTAAVPGETSSPGQKLNHGLKSDCMIKFVRRDYLDCGSNNETVQDSETQISTQQRN